MAYRHGTVAFLGLGAMGSAVAGRMARQGFTIVGYDKSVKTIQQFVDLSESEKTKVHGVETIKDAMMYPNVSAVVSCLPNSDIVDICVNEAVSSMLKMDPQSRPQQWVDTTSGNPIQALDFQNRLQEDVNVCYTDVGLSGGPRGANAGVCTSMVGAHQMDVQERQVEEIIDSFSAKVFYLGGTGNGHATKAVNNALLAAHTWNASEAALALKDFGVDVDEAIRCINESSGSSFATQDRLPKYILNRKFDFGFAVPLLAKDVNVCMTMANSMGIRIPALEQMQVLWNAANEELKALNPEQTVFDHTEVIKLMEHWKNHPHEAPTKVENTRNSSSKENNMPNLNPNMLNTPGVSPDSFKSL